MPFAPRQQRARRNARKVPLQVAVDSYVAEIPWLAWLDANGDVIISASLPLTVGAGLSTMMDVTSGGVVASIHQQGPNIRLVMDVPSAIGNTIVNDPLDPGIVGPQGQTLIEDVNLIEAYDVDWTVSNDGYGNIRVLPASGTWTVGAPAPIQNNTQPGVVGGGYFSVPYCIWPTDPRTNGGDSIEVPAPDPNTVDQDGRYLRPQIVVASAAYIPCTVAVDAGTDLLFSAAEPLDLYQSPCFVTDTTSGGVETAAAQDVDDIRITMDIASAPGNTINLGGNAQMKGRTSGLFTYSCQVIAT